tara:strand:- start:1467 stop:1985 length:519 start_codon:yes stop_codon:yes gene_type:complete
MLGIGNGLPSHRGTYNEVLSYTSDFSSGVNGWEFINEEGEVTLTGNVDGFDGVDDWLKGEYSITQTDTSGIQLSSYGNIKAGDFTTVTFKIHLSEDWNGSDIVATKYSIGGLPLGIFYVTQDTTQTVNKTLYHTADSSTLPKIFWDVTSDLPQAGAIFHIKDIVFKTFRLNG